MSRKSQIVTLLLLVTSTLADGTDQGKDSTEQRIQNGAPISPPPGQLKRTASQDLRTFFNTDIKPLSFSDFNLSPSVRAVENYAEKNPTIEEFQGQTEPTVVAGSVTNNILHGIRDLRLTLAEMDEKLDRVVQKVAPTGNKPGMMKKGSQIFKRLFHIPSSPEEGSGVGQERGLGYFRGPPESGIGLRYG